MSKFDFTKVNLDDFRQPKQDEPFGPSLKSTMSEATNYDPDKQVKINKLSTQTKIPVDTVERNYDTVDKQNKLESIDWKSLGPATTSFLNDIQKAKTAHDDVLKLNRVETNVKKTLLNNSLRGIGARATDLVGNLATFVGVTGQDLENKFQTGRFIFADSYTKPLEETAPGVLPRWVSYDEWKKLQAEGKAEDSFVRTGQILNDADFGYTPQSTWETTKDAYASGDVSDSISETLQFAFEQGTHSLPDMLATVFTLPTYVLSRSTEMGEARAQNKGKSQVGTEDIVEAAPFAIASSLLERILPASVYGKMSNKEINKVGVDILMKSSSGLKRIMGETGRGLLTESSTEFVQEGIIEYIGERYGTEAKMSAAEAFDQGLGGAIAGGISGGGISGAVETAVVISNTVADNKINEAEASSSNQQNQLQQEQTKLDEINDAVSDSALRQRDPDSFKEFVESVEDAPGQVFIDAVQLSLYLNQRGNDTTTDPALALLSTKVDEASKLGGDATLTLAEFASTVAGTEHYNNIRDIVTLNENTENEYRQEQLASETETYVNNLLNQAAENVSEYVESQQVFENVKQQLIDTGLVTPKNARIMAQIVPAWATVYAEKNGISVIQAYEQSGLTISGPTEFQIKPTEEVINATIENDTRQDRRQESAPIDTERRADADRRVNVDLREQIDNMSKEDVYAAVYTNDLTGLRNRRAFDQVVNSAPVVVSIDIDSLKAVNDNLGHDAGDALLKTAASNLNDVFGENAYHISGDEFYILSENKDQVQQGLIELEEKLNDAVINVPTGTINGVKFTSGIGDTKGDADSQMEQQKVSRETSGERTPRGEIPANIIKKEKLEQKERGYFEPENSLIRLTQAADLSTFLHEFAHFIYEMEMKTGSKTMDSINNWFKRNAKEVAKEANEYLGKEGELAQPAFHATAHQFDKFSLEAMGSGEGNQNYGWGLYFASNKSIVEWYRDKFDGRIVNVQVPENSELLDHDAPLSEQPLMMEKLGINPDKKVGLDTQLLATMSGREVYDRLSQGRTNRGVTSKQEASEYLASLGIPGLKYQDASGTGSNFVIWEADRIEITDVQQQQEQATRLLQPSDYDAGESQSGPVTEQDVVTYLDEGTTADKAKDAAIRRATHEQFARGFEKYLMEGKAPSVELRNAFRAFARWLTQLYKRIRGNLNVNLDAEMRSVFDRLLATEEQIDRANARKQYEPLFTDAVMAGMTEEEWQKYKEQQSKKSDRETETLRDQLINEITRQTKRWWKEEKQTIADEILESLSQERVYKTISSLKNVNSFKLDRVSTRELIGEERTDRRGITSNRLPSRFNGMTVTGAQGVHPDEAAAFFGYSSGAEMLQDIRDVPTLKEAVENRAEKAMLDRHGDILNDGTIEQRADEALVTEEYGSLLIQELKVLNRRTDNPAIDRMTIKQLAADNIAKLSFKDIHPGKYRRAELRAAKEAAVAMREGNVQAAASAKGRQVLNYYLHMAAVEAKSETMKIVDNMARYSKKKTVEAIKKAQNGYWEQIEKILSRFEFRKSVSMKAVDRENLKGLESWMEKRIEKDGDALILSKEALNEGYTTHWKNVPHGELLGISDSIKNIEHVARHANKITLLNEEQTFQETIASWVDSMNQQESRFKSQRTDVVEGKKYGRWFMAQMTKIPYLASWLDGGERAGLSHDLLVQPMTNAYNEELLLWKKIGNKVAEAIENRSKADIKRHNTKIYIPEIKNQLNSGNLYGHQVLAVALNTGNQSNLKKLLLGEGWANPENESEITFDNPKLQAILQYMTKSDWELVQLIWDQMEQLYPMLADVHRKSTGLTPPKIESSPIVTEFGTFRGGYYPVKYDPHRDHQADLDEDQSDAVTESMFSGTGSLHASVTASATSERTNRYGPIRLSLDVVNSHFQETIHYITHHDAVRQVNKLVRNKTVADTIRSKVGKEEYDQLVPWLNDIAKDGREQPIKMFWDDMLGRLRFGMTLGVMGFKASTGIIQISGLSNTVAEVGLKNVAKSLRNILGSTTNMKDAWDFANSNSKVLNHRTKTMDREIKNALQRLSGKRGMLAAVQEASMKHIAYIQTYMVDLPSWYAAYMKSLEQYGDQERAFKYADWVVENVQGSGATKDMAKIVRNQTETGRMFTMFMTFFSSLWNMERDLVKGAKSGLYSRTTVAAKLMFLFSIPVVFEMLLRGELGDEDNDEELQTILLKTATYPVQSVPFVRDVVNGATGQFGYNISPIQALLEQGLVAAPKMAEALVTDKEVTKSQAKGTTKLGAAALGIPGTAQAWATGEHLYDILVEGEDFTMREFLFGPERKPK